MLFDPARHEPLAAIAWDEQRARATIARIAADTEQRFSPDTWWPTHPRDAGDGAGAPCHMLYCGACGVIWALHYLESMELVSLERSYAEHVPRLLEPNRAGMQHADGTPFGAYLMGDTSIEMLNYWYDPTRATAGRLEQLIAATVAHPARELMWGAPGTMLAASMLHGRTGDPRWARLFRSTAQALWLELEYSATLDCRYWTQDLYGSPGSFLDGVHGFAATASVLIRGRHLFEGAEWDGWAECIERTICNTAIRDGEHANWPVHVVAAHGDPSKMLVQFCHGAPGFVTCLADFPGPSLDELLLAAGSTTWLAGPLRKGANLCHGTGGNGYAFLKLHRRFNDPVWLERARTFAMHAIAQCEADREQFGQFHYSLWTGDLGFAVYLWDCIRGGDRFPTLDAFFVD